MSEQLVSRYKFNSMASKKKHIFARLLDYFSTFVLSYLLFTISFSIFAPIPPIRSISDRLSNINRTVAAYIDSTHLQRLNEGKNGLISLEKSAEIYASNIAMTCAYVYDLDFYKKQSDGTYIKTKITKEETLINNMSEYALDPLSYYFISFKSDPVNEGLDDYEGYDNKETYLFKHIIESDDANFIATDDANYIARAEGLSRYNILSAELTDSIIKYFHGDTASTEAHKILYLRYINAVQKGIKEVQTKSVRYLGLMDEYKAANRALTGALALLYFLTYLFTYVLLTMLTRLFCKEWLTLGQKVMGLGVCDMNDNEVSPLRLFFYHIINALMFFSSSIAGLYFMGLTGVLGFSVIPYVTILSIDIALLTLNVISFLLSMFNRNNFDLSTFITRINFKDTKEYDLTPDAQALLESEAEDGNRTNREI